MSDLSRLEVTSGIIVHSDIVDQFRLEASYELEYVNRHRNPTSNIRNSDIFAYC